MEAVLAALGAKTVDWNYKTECCGAGMTMANEDTVLELAHKILSNAAEHRRQLPGGRLPHVPREPRHEAGGDRAPVRRRSRAWLFTTFPTWSDWHWDSSAEQLGINRHFVTKA